MSKLFVQHHTEIIPFLDSEKDKNLRKVFLRDRKNAISRDIYADAGNLYPWMVSHIKEMAAKEVCDKFKSDCKEVCYSLKKSLASFRRDGSFSMRSRNCKFVRVADDIFLETNLLSKSTKALSEVCEKPNKDEEFPKKFKLLLATRNLKNGHRQDLKRILSGESKFGSPRFVKSKNGYDLIVPFEQQKAEAQTGLTIGIDLGVKCAFYGASVDSWKRIKPEDTHEIYAKAMQFKKRRKQYQKQAKVSNRSGRGRRHVLRPLEKLSTSERYFRETKYKQWVRMIIDFCLNYGFSVIVLEDLNNLKKDNALIAKWAPFKFQELLILKASEFGIDVLVINPADSSRRCSWCGYTAAENRVSRDWFLCKQCGKKADADHNAARNLSSPLFYQGRMSSGVCEEIF